MRELYFYSFHYKDGIVWAEHLTIYKQDNASKTYYYYIKRQDTAIATSMLNVCIRFCIAYSISGYHCGTELKKFTPSIEIMDKWKETDLFKSLPVPFYQTI